MAHIYTALNRSTRGVKALAFIFFVISTAGCSTPQPAKDLAAQGAVTADMAQTEVEAFIVRSTQAYKRREAVVTALAHGQIRDASANDFRTWISAEAGMDSNTATADQIRKIADKSRDIREKREADLAVKTKQLNDAFGSPIKLPTESLAEAKKSFLTLAQELSPQEWLKFSFDYAKQLQSDLKAIKDQADTGTTSK